MKYDIDKIPFSRYGSYFVISKDSASGNILLRDLHGGDEAPSNLYRLKIKGHRQEDLVWKRTETELCFVSCFHDESSLGIVMGPGDTIYIRAHKMDYILEAEGGKYDTLVELSDNQCEHHLYGKQLKVMCTLTKGLMNTSQEWAVIGSKDAQICVKCPDYGQRESCLVIESYKTVWEQKEYPSYDNVKSVADLEYRAWDSSFPNETGDFEDSRQLAAYITWANFVHKEGCLPYDAMYMSKNWMFNIWSWDNCYGAIALSRSRPELAFNQLRIFFETQDKSGVYPDYVNDSFASYNCAKPPIFAWAYRKMLQNHPYFARPEIMDQVYTSLCRVTRYWMDYRTHPKAEFPVYYHGNDSGWDNASVFHRGFPVESPDLAAFVIYQMDVLADLASKLGRIEEAGSWRGLADEWFIRFMERFCHEERFFAFDTLKQERITEGDSLLLYLPIMIAYRMERSVSDHLVWDLEQRFETPYGLATEAPESKYYKKGGYWLGPVWAPTSYLFIDALASNGYEQFAKRLAEKFCRLTQVGLMSENYDPFTGEGYDDPAFSWPSCVILQLLSEK